MGQRTEQAEQELEVHPQLPLDFEVEEANLDPFELNLGMEEWELSALLDEQCDYDMLMNNELQQLLEVPSVVDELMSQHEDDKLQQHHQPLQEVPPVLDGLMSQQEDDKLQQLHQPLQEVPPVHEQLPSQNNDPPEEEKVDCGTEEHTRVYRKGRWDDAEHRLFLMGQKDHPNQWTVIAEKYVTSRSESQVASHAQKYFEHLEKKRAQDQKRKRKSIFDASLENINDNNNHDHDHDVHQHQQPPQSNLHVPPHLLNLHQNTVPSPCAHSITFPPSQSQLQFQSLPQFQFQPQQPPPHQHQPILRIPPLQSQPQLQFQQMPQFQFQPQQPQLQPQIISDNPFTYQQNMISSLDNHSVPYHLPESQPQLQFQLQPQPQLQPQRQLHHISNNFLIQQQNKMLNPFSYLQCNNH